MTVYQTEKLQAVPDWIKLLLCTPSKHMGGGGAEALLHSFLTSAVDRVEWIDSHCGRLVPEDKISWYPLYVRLGGAQSLSERRGEENVSCL
jgi:hypothetical protein